MKLTMTFEQAAAMAAATSRSVRAYAARMDVTPSEAAAQILGALIGAMVSASGPGHARQVCSSIIDTLEAHAARDDVSGDVLELEVPEGLA